MFKKLRTEAKVAILYFSFGFVWFLFGNIIEDNFPVRGMVFHNIIDAFFIISTAILLYLFLYNAERTKQKLVDSEGQIRGIFDSSQEMIIVLDNELRIINFNKKYADDFRRLYRKEAERGMLFYQYAFSENDLGFVQVKKRLAMALSGESFEIEREMIYEDRSIWITVSYNPIRDKNGFVKSIIVSISDITKHKQNLRETESAKIKFESIFNHSTDALFILDYKTYEILDCNATAIHMFEIDSKEQIIGKQGSIFYKTPLDDEERRYIRKEMEGNEPFSHEFEYCSLKGRSFWGNFSSNLVETGSIPIRIVKITDITPQKYAELAIRENENKFRHLADTSPTMLWTSDPNGLISFFNTAWLNFRGRSFEEEIGNGWIDGVHPDDRQAYVYDLYLSSVKEKTSYQVEFRLRRHDGEYRWMFETGAPRINIEGIFEGFVGSVIDITERKEIEEKLKESEHKFRELADSSPAMLWISDVEGKVVFYNQAWLKFRGIPLEEEITGGWKEGIHPDDYNRLVYEVYNPSIQERKSYTTEYRLKKYDHQYRWILENAVPKYNAKDQFEGFFGSAVDITERKTAELLLKQQEKFNSRISELSPDNIYIYDLVLKQNIYNNRNFTAFLGYSSEEYPVFNEAIFLKLIHPDDLDRVRYTQDYFMFLEEMGLVEMEYRMMAKTGEYRWLQSREIIFSFDENGNANQILGNIRDITEKKMAEQALIRTNNELQIANEELDGFVYRASHDLRAPLASVLGLISILKSENQDDSALKYLDMMQKSVEKLMSVIQDLIDHSRNTRMDINSDLIDFNELVNSILEGLKFHENALKIDFSIHIEGDIPFYSDRLRLVMLFNNLISNAIKYHDFGKPNPYLKINIKKTENFVYIKIEDNGVGIEEQYHDKIFNMFFRASKHSSGSGLGLYIVKGVLEKLKGTVNFKSEYRAGTTFFVEIPNLLSNVK